MKEEESESASDSSSPKKLFTKKPGKNPGRKPGRPPKSDIQKSEDNEAVVDSPGSKKQGNRSAKKESNGKNLQANSCQETEPMPMKSKTTEEKHETATYEKAFNTEVSIQV